MELFSQNFTELIPTYGRDYKTAKAAIADFDSQKDFMIASVFLGQQLINKQQIKTGTIILLRYDRLMKLAKVKV
jgi:hypothetical protein